MAADEQRRRDARDQDRDLMLKLPGPTVELAEALDELAGDLDDGPHERLQVALDAIDDALATQSARANLEAGVDLVEMPAQPALQAGALTHEIIAVIDQQPQLALGAIELRSRYTGNLAPLSLGREPCQKTYPSEFRRRALDLLEAGQECGRGRA